MDHRAYLSCASPSLRNLVLQRASGAVFPPLTFGAPSVWITRVDDMTWNKARQTARQLVRVMEAHEQALARAAETRLFPGGPPARVSIATMMRALVATMMDAAEHMAEADAAYNATRRQRDGQGAATSLVSQDVAEKVALSVELQDLVLQHADDAGARLERRLFPDGLPEQIGMLGIFQALRRRIELAATQDASAPGGADSADTRDILEREMFSVARLFADLSEICDLPAPSRAVRAVIDIGNIDDRDDLGAARGD
jgi:hypothetical protein